MASSFPNLPGHIPTQPLVALPYRKAPTKKLVINNNKKIEMSYFSTNQKNVEQLQYPIPNYKPPQQPDQKGLLCLSGMMNPHYLSTTHESYMPKTVSKDQQELFQPKWVKMDRHVLRFYGYFKESVTESQIETFRLRKDNSLSAVETKQSNSGIPQGYFFRRQKYLRSDQSGFFITPYDFRVGSDILIYGKNIHIYDCDQYTRDFFVNVGQPQQYSEQPIEDNWTKITTNKFVPKKDFAMKDYLEHMLGGGRVNSQKQFFQNDRKVLKFYAFSENSFIIHYYLADDTIEIRQINLPNSGRDPFPVACRRQKLPRKFALNQPGQTYAQDFLKSQDIKFGQNLEVFGRYYQINGCDQFTSNYYKQKFGRQFPITDFQSLPIPPYNGFGDQQDSLGYVYRLVPKPPKKDFYKWVDNQICLRFTAKFNTKVVQDINRRFVITYFLNDDSFQIYEPPIRNSGIQEGKFLERGKYKNFERNNEPFTPADFIIGKDVKINGYSYHIIDCDLFTKKWYAEHTKYQQ